MKLDKKSAQLPSDIFLDLSKAWIIGTSVTPILSGHTLNLSILIIGTAGAILSLMLARLFVRDN